MIVRFYGKKEGFLFAFGDITDIRYNEAGFLLLSSNEWREKVINRLSYDYYTIEMED